MATYCLSIHDLRLLLRQTEHTADSWPLDSDSDQLDHDNQEENTADDWSTDADPNQRGLDDNEGRKLEQLDRKNVVGHSEYCPGIQTKRRRRQRINGLVERDYLPRDGGDLV
jgi:hypothetical protein